jgi:hypothetical protein
MRRFLPTLMALAFAAALGGSATAAAGDKMSSMTATTTCPAGSSWVKGHMDKKTHKMTKGYCRKGKMKKM